MKFRITAGGAAAALWIWLLLLPGAALGASGLEDGTYTANYLVLKAENDSVSMANDYWEKPATVTVKDGKATVRLTINHSKWVTEFKVPGGGGYVDTKVVVTNRQEDKRVVEFAADVSGPIISKIHVTVAEIDYDHDYTIRIVFDPDSFKLVQAAVKETAPSATAQPAATAEPTAAANSGSGAAGGGNSSSAGASGSSAAEATATAQPTATATSRPGASGAEPQATATAAAQSGNAQGGAQAASGTSGQSEGASGRSEPTADPAAATEQGNGGAAVPSAVTEANGASDAATEDSSGIAVGNGEESGGGTGGETQQTGEQADTQAEAPADEASGAEAAVETIAAVGDGSLVDESSPAPGFNWWAPLVAVLLLLVGGSYIVWRRKARTS